MIKIPNILNKDRINNTDFSFCIRLQYSVAGHSSDPVLLSQLLSFFGIPLNFVPEEGNGEWVERCEPSHIMSPGVLWTPRSN